MDELEKAMESRLAPLEAKLMSSILDISNAVTQKVTTYAAVVSSSVQPSRSGVAQGLKSPSYRADPTRAVLVTKPSEPTRFLPSRIKQTFSELCADAMPLISYARMLNSGKLLVEARSAESRQSLLDLFTPSPFGPNSSAAAMDTRESSSNSAGKKWLIVSADQAGISLCVRALLDHP